MINKTQLIAHIKLDSDENLMILPFGQKQQITAKLPRNCARVIYFSTDDTQLFYIRGRLSCETPNSIQKFVIEQINPI